MDGESLAKFRRLMDDVVVLAEAARNDAVDSAKLAMECVMGLKEDIEAAQELLEDHDRAA